MRMLTPQESGFFASLLREGVLVCWVQSHLQDCTQACAYKSSAAWCTVHMDIVEFSIATLLKLSGMSNDGTTHREVSTRSATRRPSCCCPFAQAY